MERPVNWSVSAASRARFAKESAEKWSSGPATIPWADETLNLIVKYQQNPLRAARIITYVDVAMHDALIVAKRAGLDDRAQRVAIHSAASATLEYFYPEEPAGRFGALGVAATLAERSQSAGAQKSLAAAWTIGQQIALAARTRASDDGAAERWSIKNRPAPRPGLWQAAPPLNAYRPAEPVAGKWRTWLLKDGAELATPPPTPFDSAQYWAEAREVLDVHTKLTADQKKIADKWHLGQGTVTPAGVWNLEARDITLRKKLTTAESARLYAALNMAMMDAFIACWQVKFAYWTQRPVTAIQAKLRPDFLPYLITPPFPSYLSGHATVSGAATEVLAAFFPDDAGLFRSMAEEAALSRLYGGIHFRSDNERGLALGREIGRIVMQRLGKL